MHTELLNLFGITINGWKIVGYIGTLMFTGRWIIQLIASRKARRSVMPRAFWYMSLFGSTLLLLYFIFGKPDSVGFLSNSFPTLIAVYNLYLVTKHDKHEQQLAAQHAQIEMPPQDIPSDRP
jgi:lipid-A-disaccharide synthase-like uncharacterized protein